MSDKKIVSIIGGNGFIGKYLVNKLIKKGYYINIVSRNAYSFKKIHVQPRLGQVSLKSCDIKDQKNLIKVIEGSHYVFNLTGLLVDNTKNSFNDVHIEGTKNLILAAKENKVKKVIHVSAIGAAKNSKSKYATTKYQAELNIKNYKDYLIVRPSIVYGDEDKFINLFAKMSQFSPIVPLVGKGITKFQPIWVEDLTNIIYKLVKKNISNVTVEVGGS